MLVIFSIGNPGPSNRHSVGHQALGRIATHAKQLTKHKLYSLVTFGSTVFVRSGLYMNESHKALEAVVNDYRINLAHDKIVVLYDDFELALGKIKVAPLSKNDSHNGIKCIHRWLQSRPGETNVYKLGIGIGPKPQSASKDTMASWVLADFSLAEKARLKEEVWPKLDRIDMELDGEINYKQLTRQING